MYYIKKEWKWILAALWLVATSAGIIRLYTQVERINAQNEKIASTLDAVESIVISTDSGISQMGKKVSDMDSNIDFIIQLVRRR